MFNVQHSIDQLSSQKFRPSHMFADLGLQTVTQYWNSHLIHILDVEGLYEIDQLAELQSGRRPRTNNLLHSLDSNLITLAGCGYLSIDQIQDHREYFHLELEDRPFYEDLTLSLATRFLVGAMQAHTSGLIAKAFPFMDGSQVPSRARIEIKTDGIQNLIDQFYDQNYRIVLDALRGKNVK